MDGLSTTQNPINPAGDDEHLELVAYLDGELDAQACADLESRLLVDDSLQQKLNELSSVWDMLDSLPQIEAADGFAQSTMELAIVSTENQMAAGNGRWYLPVRILILFTAVLMGFGLSRWIQGDDDRLLIDDFEVIENLDLYRLGDSVEFLEQLDDQGLFTRGQIRE